MAFDNTVTVVGNVTRDPELRFTPGGMAVASFGVAWNKRKQDGEDEVSFFDVTCFRQLAENVAESVAKGTRVMIYGSLQQSSWNDRETGDKRTKVEILADEVAPSLKWATAEVRKNDRSDAGGGPRSGGAPQGGGRPAPSGGYDTDEEPF
jgi:single-strand DNA-binding protein